MITVLSGGTGTPKLLQGLVQLVGQGRVSVIVNTGEDLEMSGLYISPDLDTVTYTLAGLVNEETWYGIHGDTFDGHERLKRDGKPELLRIGDLDREVKKRRTDLLGRGKGLSQATAELCKDFGVAAKILPMSDDRVRTRVYTEIGPLSFHEFLVARRAKDRVTAVAFEGTESARPAPGVIEALTGSEAIIIGPSNPVTSIGPILSIKEINKVLVREKQKVFALSPIIGGAPVSGPAGSFMKAIGHEVSPVGLAEIYKGLVGTMIIDNRDAPLGRQIEGMGMRAFFTDLLMPDLASRVKVARAVLSIAGIQK